MADRGQRGGLPGTAAALALGLCAVLAVFGGCATGGSEGPRPAKPASVGDATRARGGEAPPAAAGQPLADRPVEPVTPLAPTAKPDVDGIPADAPTPVLFEPDMDGMASSSLRDNYSLSLLQSTTTAWTGELDAVRAAETGAAAKSAEKNDRRMATDGGGDVMPKDRAGGEPGQAWAGPGGGAAPRDAVGGGGGGESPKPGAAPTADPAPKNAPEAAAPTPPAGRSVGRPASGVTAEQRRDKLQVPARVGFDEEAVKEAVAAGVAPRLALHPEPRFDEELWVIQRPPRAARGVAGEAPRSGALMLREAPRSGERPAVLRETTARATISGPVSRVTLTQRFENPQASAVDAVYVLPLPRDAAITDFVMTVGTRRIRGVIRERAEAERIFLDAQRQGKVVSLLSEDSPNLFVQKVGNLASGAALDVTVTYFNTLEYADGAYEFVLPLAASPQYQGDASVSAEVRDGRGVSVEVQIDAGVPIRGVQCATHDVDVSAASGSEAMVVLRPASTLPNRDLVIRIAVAGREGPTVGVLPQTDPTGTYFTMVIVPPGRESAEAMRGPIELILVPDRAALRAPEHAAMLRAAAARLAAGLNPRDRLLIASEREGPRVPVPATPEAVAAALAELDAAPVEPLAALLRAALRVPAPGGDRVVCVLTRGEPEGAVDLLRDARVRLGAARLFAVCLDEPGAGFTIESLARIGRGGVIHLAAGVPVDGPLDAFMAGVSRPVLTDLSIDWGGAEVADLFPRRLPDLCAGRPVHVVGRLVAPPPAGRRISVVGTSRGPSGLRRESYSLPWREASAAPGAVHTLWARAKVLSMSETLGLDASADAAVRREILDLALSHNLVSPFTSFIAVDAMSSVEPGRRAATRDPQPKR